MFIWVFQFGYLGRVRSQQSSQKPSAGEASSLVSGVQVAASNGALQGSYEICHVIHRDKNVGLTIIQWDLLGNCTLGKLTETSSG